MLKKIQLLCIIFIFIAILFRIQYLIKTDTLIFNKNKTPTTLVYTPDPSDYYCKSSNSDNTQVDEKEIQKNIGYKNNKFGLYIYSEKGFVKKADELVNSNGGDWGYVLIPYNVKDYDGGKWKDIFGLLNKHHLIPIIQLWDVDPDKYKEQTAKSAEFLSKQDWPISKKYISAYNEMNDNGMWNGDANPREYAQILDYTIQKYKQVDSDFFIMNGAFNPTAPNHSGYIDQVTFMEQMEQEVPGIFKNLDGWASHPYPQPAYLGKPTDTGRWSIRAYEWELDLLKNKYGTGDLPVFITETGWPHAEGKKYNPSYYSEELGARYTEEAYKNVWLPDDRVVAVMPFTIYYDPPYDHFSWIKKDGGVYKKFDVVKNMPKIAGKPPIINKDNKNLINCP